MSEIVHKPGCPQYRAAADDRVPPPPSLADRIRATRTTNKPGSIADKLKRKNEAAARFAAHLDATKPSTDFKEE